MLKLILNPQSDAKVLIFDENCLLVGNAHSAQAHLKLDDPSLQDIHLKILTEADRSVVVNIANDPFTSLNGHPFGKKPLKDGDLIQLGSQAIQFVAAPTVQQAPLEPEEPQQHFNIDALLEQIDQLGAKPAEKPLPQKAPVKKLDKCEPVSKSWNEKKTKKKAPVPNWKTLAKALLVIVVISAATCGIVYFRAQGNNSQEEKKIAAGIADVAMALTYAQLNHISPGNQNLLDPDFIRSNLGCVLSPHLHTQAKIDAEGRFPDTTYTLRAYANNSMTRFLVIAQPLPHFFQWIYSKKTFVIDSSSMQIHKISDLKSLNRLLASPAPLEAKNGAEITRIIQQGQLISLPALAGSKSNWGFVPPKSLSWVHPGAESYVYNAPRYYPFGETILRDVLAHFHDESGRDDALKLREQIADFARLKDLVLYTSLGLETALEAEKALALIHPDHPFLIGYLQFNATGYVAQSHLLIHEKHQEVSFESSAAEADESIPSERNDVVQHPLALRLRAIAVSRQKCLRPLGAQITALIEQQNEGDVPGFYEEIEDRLVAYRDSDFAARSAMIQEISQLYQEYSDMPLQHFMGFVEEANLTGFVARVIDDRQIHFPEKTLTEESIWADIRAVDSAANLLELDEKVQKAIAVLNLEQFPYPNQLVAMQKELNEMVVEKLVHFLLSQNSPYVHEKVGDTEKTALIRTLKSAWVSDPHEFDYFVSEFDQLKLNE